MSEDPKSLAKRIAGLFKRGTNAPRPAAPEVSFSVGDRVRDIWGKEAVVLEIDASAEHGLGRLRVRYDDGRELNYSMLGHPFSPISKSS